MLRAKILRVGTVQLMAYSPNEWNMRVPIVEMLLREINPEGVSERRHRLRTIYHNPSSNYAWHCDSYNKLKPFGFPNHGCIDGWSRNIIW